MTKPGDDLEAVRDLVATLEPFGNDDRERIIRWAREKLGMTSAGGAPPASSGAGGPPSASGGAVGPAKDIKAFIEQKKPRTDNQLAAVVAYYHQFVAPEAERKDFITAEDLLEACRKAENERPAAPKQTLVNTYSAGLLDRAGRGSYRLNSVGENLVAMVLPDDGTGGKGKNKGKPGKGKKRRVVKPAKKGRAAAKAMTSPRKAK